VTHPAREDGLATIELALVAVPLLALLAFCAPLFSVLLKQNDIARAASATARYATTQLGPTTSTPSHDQVVAYARSQLPGVEVIPLVINAPACSTGKALRITLYHPQPLGLLGGFLTGMGFTHSDSINLSSSATNCQE
jgi:hypothetical protein